MNKIINWMLSRKILIARSTVFFSAMGLTLIGKEYAVFVFNFDLFRGIKTYHLLWAFVMAEMILVLIPKLNHFTGCGKLYEKYYTPKPHNEQNLIEDTRKYDRRALFAAAIWSSIIIAIGVFRLDTYWVVMIAVLFYYLDQLFVNIWCPFQHWIIRNRCCATCRIYNWGFPFIVSPLIYLKSFWSYSLVAMGVVILVQWEFLHYKHPERFSEVSNATLLCKNCNDKCRKMLKAS